MASNQTPEQAAAANTARINRLHARQALLARVLAAQENYTGQTALHIRITAEEATLVEDLNIDLPAWSFHASPGGNLYFGTERQIAAVKIRELGEQIPNQPIHRIEPPATERPTLQPLTEDAPLTVVPVAAEAPTTTTITAVLPVKDDAAVDEQRVLPPVAAVVEANDVAAELPLVPVESAVGASELPLVPVDQPTVPAEPKATDKTDDGTAQATERTFKVCDVEPETDEFKTEPVAKILKKVLGFDVEACGAGVPELIKGHGFHGLVEATHAAFAGHYGLELSPDEVWVTIIQGFARLVNLEPEKYRSQFVLHEGQQEIRILRNDFTRGSATNDWPSCFGQFSEAIGRSIGADNYRLVTSNFSTTGPIERAASDVVLMDTVQSYFKYCVDTLCGIPFVRLRGTVADWRQLVAKARGLATFGALAWWLDELVPILEKIADAAAGKVDADFWNRIYKAKEESGGVLITGWIVRLLPTVYSRREKKDILNPLLGTPLNQPHVPNPKSRRYYGNRFDDDYVELGWGCKDSCLNTSMLPASLSTVPFIWSYLGTEYKYKIVGGVVGYSQNPTDGALRAQLGWGVYEDTGRTPRFKDDGY